MSQENFASCIVGERTTKDFSRLKQQQLLLTSDRDRWFFFEGIIGVVILGLAAFYEL